MFIFFAHHFLHAGVFCQLLSSVPIEKCPGDNVTFTCVVTDTSGTSSTRWIVTTPDGESSTLCVVLHDLRRMDTCGPNGEFTSSFFGQNGNNYTSALSVSDYFNETMVECGGPSSNSTEDICIVGEYKQCLGPLLMCLGVSLRSSDPFPLPHYVWRKNEKGEGERV